jgi:predicted GIY-YIG superfamily endonuclease
MAGQGEGSSGVAAKYGVDRLVWFEQHETIEAAMLREQRIERDNPRSLDPRRGVAP